MRIIIAFCLIFVLIQNPADALFSKKDYRQIFLNNASNAEKRQDYKSAFHSYEKAIYYYKKDKKVIEAYAGFCERQKYFQKAIGLYERLYKLTKDERYLFKKNLCMIKDGNLSESHIRAFIENSSYSVAQKNELNKALVYHFSYKKNWKNVKKYCANIPKNQISSDVIYNCIDACKKDSDKKSLLAYYLRLYDLDPKNSQNVNQILELAEEFDDHALQLRFVKKLSELNPSDKGIKYRLAGLYEKKKDWKSAEAVYLDLLLSGDTSDHVKNSKAHVQSMIHPKAVEKYVSKPLSGFKLYEKQFYSAWEDKKYSEALVQLDKMQKLQPNNIKLMQHRIDILSSIGDFKQSIYEMEKLKKIRPLKSEENSRLAFYYSKIGNYSKSVSILENLKQSSHLSLEDTKFLSFSYSKLENHQKAVDVFEEVQKLHPFTNEEKIYLAFLYSKAGSNQKSILIVEELLKASPDEADLLKLAREYSLADNNWDKGIFYTEKLLLVEPDSETLIKSAGDLYSIKKDFSAAIKYYLRLIDLYPKSEYKVALANFYMADEDFSKAQAVIFPLYNTNPSDKTVVEIYLDSLMAQDKLNEAYKVIMAGHMEKTQKGYIVTGDLNMKGKYYDSAVRDYSNALCLDKESLLVQNKLAEAYRQTGNIEASQCWYKKVLCAEPENLQAKLGLGYLEIDKKDYEKSRAIFNGILAKKPCYKPAEIGVANSYISNAERFNALHLLDRMPPDDDVALMRAKIFYDLNMPSDSRSIAINTRGEEARKLEYDIRRDNAFTVTPVYSFLIQQLASEFKLDYQQVGLHLSQNVAANTNLFADYNVFVYSSGGPNILRNVTHEFRGGLQSRPVKKWEYRGDLGAKFFEFGNQNMIVTDDWIKHYFNDNFDLKFGVRRDNLIQSYLSAVGQDVDGIFTGRVADSRMYLEYNYKLPKDYYSFGRVAYGAMFAQNLPTNQYLEGMVGVGKLLYNNPKNKWLQKVNFDLVSFNDSFQYNLLDIYGTSGKLYGGYFSPRIFTADTANIKLEGEIKKWKIKYGLSGFAGVQLSKAPDFTKFTWGFGPYVSYKASEHVDFKVAYNYYNYADVQRNIFIFNVVIRGFKKNVKN